MNNPFDFWEVKGNIFPAIERERRMTEKEQDRNRKGIISANRISRRVPEFQQTVPTTMFLYHLPHTTNMGEGYGF